MENAVQHLEAFVAAKKQGLCATLLGIGPMSDTVIRAALELAAERDFPVMLIASRNQVDSARFGGGYVRGYDQRAFAEAIAKIADEIETIYGMAPVYLLCRDHGGPWQRDEERAAALPEDEAMDIAVQSYRDDIDAGFQLLHIDPTKDPHAGAVVPMDTVLERTVSLIRQTEAYRVLKNLPTILYEVGTEETNGGQTGAEAFSGFLDRLCDALSAEGLPLPVFAVGQTGTLVRLTENIGEFSFDTARELAEIAIEKGILLKEHNSDYLSDIDLLLHLTAGVGGSNVAPEFGVVETGAYIELARLEDLLFEKFEVESSERSGLFEIIKEESVRSGRFRKWLIGDESGLSDAEVLGDSGLAEKAARIGGHYVFGVPRVAEGIKRLFGNLDQFGIPAEEYVKQTVKRSIERYVTAYDLSVVIAELIDYF